MTARARAEIRDWSKSKNCWEPVVLWSEVRARIMTSGQWRRSRLRVCFLIALRAAQLNAHNHSRPNLDVLASR